MLIFRSQVKKRAESFSLEFKMDKAGPTFGRLVARLTTPDQVDLIGRMIGSVPPTLPVGYHAAARSLLRVGGTKLFYTAKS